MRSPRPTRRPGVTRRGRRSAFRILPLIVAAAAMSTVDGTALAQPLQIQFGAPFGRPGAESSEAKDVFLPYDRTARTKFRRAAEGLEEGRFSEAVRFLGEILDVDASGQDEFFDPDGNRTSYRSKKAEAERMLGALPAEGRRSYELQFGARARKLLQRAVADGDVGLLAEVSRRFFHTEAGYEATLLLAHDHLDHGRPLAAAMVYEQLRLAPQAARRFEPMLSVRAATAWSRAGMEKKARETLTTLKAARPDAQLRIAGRGERLFAGGADPLAWLARTVGLPPGMSTRLAEQWTLHRGGPGRNAQSAGGQPLLAHRWQVRNTTVPAIETLMLDRQEAYWKQGVAVLPAMHPLAVGDVALMRTVRHLVAVDIRSGKRLWEVRPYRNDNFERLVKISRSQSIAGAPQFALALEQRMWDDALFGTLSSDGERVYAVQDLDLIPGTYSSGAVMFRGGRPVMPHAGERPPSRLSAYELATEGKLKWEVGGPESDVPDLAHAFFLGPPLPLDGRLYALAEIDGSVQLVVLDAGSGEKVWKQALADMEQQLIQTPLRRMAGATPSFADGVLVCPTSAGATVAVDLNKRSLLWAYEYPQQGSGDPRQRMMMMMRRSRPAPRKNDHWIDGSATVVDGRVLLTPVESDQLHCLDLIDGSLRWKIDRDENLYLACVDKGHVVLVGAQGVTAVRLEDGKEAWSLELPEGSLPSGRGFHTGGEYFLPLTSAEVARIDLAHGKIVDRAASRDGRVPGNLICYRGEVISQGVDALRAYYQIKPLRKRIERELAADPEALDALLRQGELELYEGNLLPAIERFRSAYKIAGKIPDRRSRARASEEPRQLLVSALLEALQTDFAANHRLVDELQGLIDPHERDQRIALLRLTAAGLQQRGAVLEAFTSYLELIDLDAGGETLAASPDAAPRLERISAQLSVRRERWIQAQLAALWRDADDAERTRMEAQLAPRLAAVEAGGAANAGRTEQLRELLAIYGELPAGDQIRARLAEALIASGEKPLECELLCLRLAAAADPAHRRLAVAGMARLLRGAERYEQAAPWYRRLRDELGSEVCLGDQTGREIVAALPADDPIRRALESRHRWKRGEVAVRLGRVSSRSSGRNRRLDTLRIRGGSGPLLDGVTIALDQQTQTVVGYDSYGREEFAIGLNPPNQRRQMYIHNPGINHAAVHGHLVVMSMGYQLLALDTLARPGESGKNVRWREDLTEQIPGVSTQRPVQPRRINAPGGLPRYEAADERGRPIGMLGPIVPQGITYQKFRDLQCVDPLDGQVVWVRHDVAEGCDLWGDGDQLWVAAPGAREALVLRALDGTELGRRAVPPIESRMATRGRRVLVVDKTGDRQRIALHDPWDDRDVWSRDFSSSARLWQIEGDALGVMETSGRFVLLDLADGQPRVDARLEPEPSLAGIYLVPSGDGYLLVTNHPATARSSSRTIQPAPGGFNNPLVSGRIYAFRPGNAGDTATRAEWMVPATIDQHGLLLPQPRDLPVLAFVRHVTDKPRPGQSRTRTSVLCIDRRTGRQVYRNDSFSFGTGFYRLQGDPEKQAVTLKLPSTTVTMTFGDDPIPPEPPVQAETDTLPRARGLLGIGGAILRAFGNAAEELDAVPDANDPFK